MDEFKKELEHLINRYSIENKTDTPDFILADMVCGFIETIGPQIKKTLLWHEGGTIDREVMKRENMKGGG